MAWIKKINENALTAVEQDVFDCIVDAQKQMRYPPSVRDSAKPRALEILKEWLCHNL